MVPDSLENVGVCQHLACVLKKEDKKRVLGGREFDRLVVLCNGPSGEINDDSADGDDLVPWA